MDPTRCYLDLLEAFNKGDRERAHELATALREWLQNGVFMPIGIPPGPVRRLIGRVLDEDPPLCGRGSIVERFLAMKRSRSTVAARPKRPLEEEMERLANEVRVLRDALDELVVEIQSANQNRRCEQCQWTAGRRDMSGDFDDGSDDEPEAEIEPVLTFPKPT
ncbi:MAG: hypothetical protein IT428_17550, partial [Planctomycetaceae bacterium]|nr:hypothetical protein [Planctomycetaceae bacterium]